MSFDDFMIFFSTKDIVVCVRVVLAIICGGAIGVERG